MDIQETLRIFIFPALVAVIVALVPRFVRTPGEKRHDIRDEVKDLWTRLDTQDAKIAERDTRIEAQAQRIAQLGKSIEERDIKLEAQGKQLEEQLRRIAELEQNKEQVAFYKQRLTTVSLENDELRRKLAKYDDLEREVKQLRRRVAELEKH